MLCAEMVAFSAGVIAGSIVAMTVLIMLVAKLVCVFTGYENQLTVTGVSIDSEEQKQMLSTIVSDADANDTTSDVIQATDGYLSDDGRCLHDRF